MDNLKLKTVNALSWSFVTLFSKQGIHFVISIILARLLMPEQFGLIAMLMVFTALAQTFLISGFGTALIQKKDVTHTDCCTVLYLNVVVCVMLAGLLCIAAPWIAAFYNQPILTPLTRFLSLTIVINSLGQVHSSLLIKKTDFKTQTKIGIISTILAGTIGITLAYKGFGVWSLAIQMVCGAFSQTILLWLFHKWRPSFVFSFAALRSMLAFGVHLLASGFLSTVFTNIYLVIIGKIFSPTDLGYYTRAKGLQNLPVANLTTIINRVTLPLFSSIQDDPRRLKRGLQKIQVCTAFITFPMMIGLATVAKPLISVLLTDKWLPCVPYLQLLCYCGLLYPLLLFNTVLLLAVGRSDIYFKLDVLNKILIVISIAITYRWGIKAMIYGQIAHSAVCYFVNCHFAGNMIGYRSKEQILDIAPYLMTAVVMGAGVYSIQWLPFSSNSALLVCQIATGVIIYAALSKFFRMAALLEVVDIVKQKLRECMKSSVLSYN